MQYVERFLGCQPIGMNWVDRLADRLLPRRCLVCSLDSRPVGICDYCLKDLPWNTQPCLCCGLPLPGDHNGICGPCLRRPPAFERTVSPLLFEYPVRELIRQFKFRRNLAAGRALTRLLHRQLLACDRPDCLLPVPLHGFRLFRRGFNQAFDIARYIGVKLEIPVLAEGLRRIRPTRAQSGLDADERRRNLRGAFAWHGQTLAGKHVALVDDVMTTGTTVRECTRVLGKAGAGRVDIWVLARAA